MIPTRARKSDRVLSVRAVKFRVSRIAVTLFAAISGKTEDIFYIRHELIVSEDYDGSATATARIVLVGSDFRIARFSEF